MKSIILPPDLEDEIDGLVSSGMFHSFQTAVEELVRIGLASMKGGAVRRGPPEQIPPPEKPFIPDPSRDIYRM